MYHTRNGGTVQGAQAVLRSLPRAQAVMACLYSATAPVTVLQFTVLF